MSNKSRTNIELPEGFVHINPVLSEVVQSIQYRIDHGGFHPENLPTGVRAFDRQIGGLRRGELTVVTGCPGSGKRSFALQAARNVATNCSLPVYVFSPKIEASEIGLRILIAEGKLNWQRTPSGDLNDDEWAGMNQALGALYQSPLFINESKNLSTAGIVQAVRREFRTQSCIGLVVVDAIEYLRERSAKRGHKAFLQKILMELRSLAKDIDVPILVTASVASGKNNLGEGQCGIDDLRHFGIDEHIDMLVSIRQKNNIESQQVYGQTLVEIMVYEPYRGRSSLFNTSRDLASSTEITESF